jgi:hypothetical protein
MVTALQVKGLLDEIQIEIDRIDHLKLPPVFWLVDQIQK